MSFGRPNFGGSPIRSVDVEALRARNASAPQIDRLFTRVVALFVVYRAQVLATAVLVIASAALGVVPALLIELIFDDALFPDGSSTPNLSLLLELTTLTVAVYAVIAGINVFQAWITSRVGTRVTGDLRVRLFAHLQSMDMAFFTRTKTGSIQSRLQNDVGGVADVLTNTLASILGNAVTVLASLAAMILIDWRLTIVAVALLPLMIIAQRRVGRVRARIAGETQESLSRMTAMTQEALSVSGAMLTKSFGRQGAEISRYATEVEQQTTLQVRQAMSGQLFFGLVTVIMSSIPAVIYLAAGFFLGGDPPLTAGALVAFTTVQARLLFPLTALMRVTLDVQTSFALFARIFEYLDMEPTITDAPAAIDVSASPGPMGQVEFRNVSFRYRGSAESPATIHDVSFVAHRGQHVALVGASGAGKSTILNLAARFYEASDGEILFAGTPVRGLRHQSLLENVGVVSQETHLFHASIRENLLYAKPEASDDELIAACRAAHIHHVIETFEHGYDTLVGERGYRLSGGEKQRIAIARVVLKNPPVLLLDEATSALDTVSERVVQEALDAAARGRTTITVAHRLSTVINADIIHVVERGRIVESGSHSSLRMAGGPYSKLVDRQTITAPLISAD